MISVDQTSTGLVKAIHVATFDSGISLWRTELDLDLPQLCFTMRGLGDSTALSRVSAYTDPQGNRRVEVEDAGVKFDRLVPQWRWALTNLGLIEFDRSPIGAMGPRMSDPWIGRFRDLPSVLVEAKQLDERARVLRALLPRFLEEARRRLRDIKEASVIREEDEEKLEEEKQHLEDEAIPYPFWYLAKEYDGTLSSDLERFLDDLVDRGGEISGGDVSDDWTKRGLFDLHVNRYLFHQVGGSLEVTSWKGTSLVSFLEFATDHVKHVGWAIWPPDAYEEFFRLMIDPTGTFSIPEDEVALYRATGVELPYVLPGPQLVEWITERRRLG